MTREEWNAQGLSPDTIHPSDWNASCYCRMVLKSQADGRKELLAPLVRTKLDDKSSKRTMRAVTQNDLDRSQAAVDKALQSEKGRRTLRLLGQANGE
jgi:hypothetical protein